MHGVPRKNLAGSVSTTVRPRASTPVPSTRRPGGVFHATRGLRLDCLRGRFLHLDRRSRRAFDRRLKASDGTATSFDPNGAPGFGAFALAVASDGTSYAGGSSALSTCLHQGFPVLAKLKLVSAVSRKTHALPGPSIGLPQTGTPHRIPHWRRVRYHQVVARLPRRVTLSSASVSSGTGSVSSVTVSGNQVFVNLTGVTNAQTIVIIIRVNDGSNTGTFLFQWACSLRCKP